MLEKRKIRLIKHKLNAFTKILHLEELDANVNLYQIWDKFSTFTEQFGIYKSGGGSFDRSIYNSVYNGEEELSHQT